MMLVLVYESDDVPPKEQLANLRQHFSRVGPVRDLTVLGRSHGAGVACIIFESEEDAKRAEEVERGGNVGGIGRCVFAEATTVEEGVRKGVDKMMELIQQKSR